MLLIFLSLAQLYQKKQGGEIKLNPKMIFLVISS